MKLNLTHAGDDGFELRFQTTESYLYTLSQQIKNSVNDDTNCAVLKFEDIQPVAARVDNYLSGTEYDSIGMTSLGLNYPRGENNDSVLLRVLCSRDQLRRFASLNRVHLESPITFTASITTKNAHSFINSVSELRD